jgi:hypothetical protein
MVNQGVVPPPAIWPGCTPRCRTRPLTGEVMVMRETRVRSSFSAASWALAW